MNRPLPELMGAQEVAAALDVSVSNLDRVANLPEADQRLKCGRIWRADVVRQFATDRKAQRRERRSTNPK